MDFGETELGPELEALATSGELVLVGTDLFKLAEATVDLIRQRIKETAELEALVRSRFAESLSQHGVLLAPEPLWTAFREMYLVPLVAELGARTYRLLLGRLEGLKETAQLRAFLGKVPDHLHASVRRALADFLNATDPNVRAFLLAELNTRLLVEAGSLSADDLDGVQRLVGESVAFHILLDTNFVFSVLNLHENPSNDAARSLLGLASALRDRVDVRLFVADITAAEARRTLRYFRDSLRRVRFTPKILEAAANSEFSGIPRRFIQVSEESGVLLKPDDYFNPYIDSLPRLLEQTGVEALPTKLDNYLRLPNVRSDVLALRGKPREAWTHDVALWHFVDDERGSASTALEAKWWIATLDFHFIRFDEIKRGSVEALPICVAPAALAELLQFWLPRTPELEAAIVNGLKAFVGQTFDPGAEQMTLRILEALSRYENVDDLPVEVITGVVANQRLLHRLELSPDRGEDVPLVREALVQEAGELKDELDSLRREKAALEDQIKRQATAPKARGAPEGKRRERRRTGAKKQDARLAARISELERQLQNERLRADALEVRTDRSRFIALWLAVLFLVVIPTAAGAGWMVARFTLGFWLASALSFVVLVAFWLRVVVHFGSRRENVAVWTVYVQFRRFPKPIWTAIGAVAVSLIGNFIWQRAQ